MGTRENPGPYDCLSHAEPDEPLFVLLARDPAAPDAIEDWADLRAKMVRHGDKPATDWPMIAEARTCAMRMREWRNRNRPSFPAVKSPKPLTRAEFDKKMAVAFRELVNLPDFDYAESELTRALENAVADYWADPAANPGVGRAYRMVKALFGEPA